MNVLITGGAGYIGSELTNHLLLAGHNVTVIDNLMYDPTSVVRYAIEERFNFIKGDVVNLDILKEELPKADVIIPLAALVGFPLCDRDKRGAVEINHGVNAWIAKNKTPEQKVIYPCTNSGYGIGEEGKYCTEESPLNPISLYGKTKVAGEAEFRNVENHVTFRLATVFGPSSRMRTDLLVNNFVLKALDEQLLVLYQSKYMRNYVHLQDVCQSFKFVIDNWEKCKNETYNMGNDDLNMNKLGLARTIQKFIPLEIMHAEFTEDLDKRDYIVSSEKFYSKGFKCQYDLDIGIEQLIKAYSIIKSPWYANY